MTLQYQHLVGRSFLPGVRDCYDHVQGIYADSFGIVLTNFARPVDWRADTRGLIREVCDTDGFEMITHWKAADLRPADILCMSIGESEANHLAVFVGDNKITHHLFGRLSSEEMYRDFYRNCTAFVARHPDVPDLRPVLPETNIRSLLSERYNLQAS